MDLLKIGLVAGVLATAATPALAAPQVSSAWSRPAAAGTTGAGFMMLTNPGKAPDALVAVESPAARSVEIHRSVMSGGVSSMRKQARVPLAPGGSGLFAPGGYHLMFMGLKTALKSGDQAPATLIFESGARVKANFEVRVSAPPEGHQHH